MATYVITMEREDGEIVYLNHSCMSTMSFGSEDMAWTTDDEEKADLMCYKAQMYHVDDYVEVSYL